jgi:hypothetical protein
LHIAVTTCNVAAVKMILQSRKFGMNKPERFVQTLSDRDIDSIALWYAAITLHYVIVDLLLKESEADVEWTRKDLYEHHMRNTKRTRTPTILDWAKEVKDEVLIALLERKISALKLQADGVIGFAEGTNRAGRSLLGEKLSKINRWWYDQRPRLEA